jgi:hypothetical protein
MTKNVMQIDDAKIAAHELLKLNRCLPKSGLPTS